MIKYLKNSSYESVRKKIRLLYILNVVDILITLALLKTNFFEEANSAMMTMVSSPMLSVIVKVFLVGALLYFIAIRLKDANTKQLKISNTIILVMVFVYCFIMCSHMINILIIFKMLSL